MKAELVLGFDPAPANPQALDAICDRLRTVVRSLVEARSSIDRLSRTGSVWDGATGEPVAAVLQAFSQRLSALGDALVDGLAALDTWRDGTRRRRERVDDIVGAVADLAGRDDAEDRRTRLLASAREVEDEHQQAATDLRTAMEDLSEAIADIQRADDDLAADLVRALSGLWLAVEEWVEAQAPELLRTATSLGEVAGLTTVISELVGVAALDRNPDEQAGVKQLISRSPGSHRLIRALRRQWVDVAPDSLPAATFADRRSTRSINERIPQQSTAGHNGAEGR